MSSTMDFAQSGVSPAESGGDMDVPLVLFSPADSRLLSRALGEGSSFVEVIQKIIIALS